MTTKKHWGELDLDKEEIDEEAEESSGLEEQESSEEELVDDDISSLNPDDYQGEDDDFLNPNAT
jgi:hypothetical protein